jgi:hypothetical protein
MWFGIEAIRSDLRPSFLTKLSDTTITQNQLLIFTYVAFDRYRDTLKYTLLNPPAGASLTPSGNFNWRPSYSQQGVFSIVVVVNKGAIADTAKATITVTKVNQKPALVSRTPSTITTVSRNAIHTFSVNVTDPNEDPVNYVWYDNNVFVKSGADTFYSKRWTDVHNTSEAVKVVFSDPAGLKDSTTWNFTMTHVTREAGGIPTEFSLFQNYPNPFNPETTIRFALPRAGRVTLEIFDLLGRGVDVLVSEDLGPGYFAVQWRGDVPSGAYLYRLQAGEFVETMKMVLLR